MEFEGGHPLDSIKNKVNESIIIGSVICQLHFNKNNLRRYYHRPRKSDFRERAGDR